MMECLPFSEYQVFGICLQCDHLCCLGVLAIIQCYSKCNAYYNKCMTLSPPNGAVYEVNGTPTHNYTEAACIKDCSNTTTLATKPFTNVTTSISPTTSFDNDSITNFTTGIIIPQSDSETPSILVSILIPMLVVVCAVIVSIVAVYIHKKRKRKNCYSDHLQKDNPQSLQNPQDILLECKKSHEGSLSNRSYSHQDEAPELIGLGTDNIPAVVVEKPGVRRASEKDVSRLDQLQNRHTQETSSNNTSDTSEETPLLPEIHTYPEVKTRTHQPEPNYDENETPLKSTVQAPAPVSEVVARRSIDDTKTTDDEAVETPLKQPAPTKYPDKKLELRKNNGNGKGGLERFPPLLQRTSQQKSLSQSQRISIDESSVNKYPEDATIPPTTDEPNKLNSNDATAHNVSNDGAAQEIISATNPGSLSMPDGLSLSELHGAGDIRAGGENPMTGGLLSLRDSLLPVGWKKAERRLDKFEVTYVLDEIPWVIQYMLDEERIDIYVDFARRPNLTYLNATEILKWLTMWEEIDFRMYEMTRSEFKPFGGGHGRGHGMGQGRGQGMGRRVIAPGAEITIKSPERGERIAAIGTILHCKEEGKYYAVTAGHCIREGEPCYQTGQKLGTCVFKYTNMLRLPYSIDIALIEIDMQGFQLENMVQSFSTTRGDYERCGIRLPTNQQEVCDMAQQTLHREQVPEGNSGSRKKIQKVQSKFWETKKYGCLRYALLTNKAEVLHRVIAVVRTAPEVPVISEGDCGSLVMSLAHNGEDITAYGMYIGRLTLQALDGSDEPKEWYVALPFDQTLEFLRSHEMFRGKSLEIVDKDDTGH